MRESRRKPFRALYASALHSRTLQFAVVAAVLRIVHALFSTAWHIEGDMGIPWLMANDWESTPSRRFFWGQDYLGTYETALLSKVGHAIWGAGGTIPVEFNFIAGQLLYVAGATAFFAALRKIKPGLGDRWWEFVLALALLGFAVPGMAKFSFSVGTGYSLTPLAVGLTAWLWAGEASVTHNAKTPPSLCLAAGFFVGLAQTVIRINLVPALAVFGCLFLTSVRHRWPARAQWRPWLLFALGLAVGFLPELWVGVERSLRSGLALFPLEDRRPRLFSSVAQAGVAFGTLPYATASPEDALFFRGHAPEFPHDLLDWASILLLGVLAYVRREDRRRPTVWILWAIVLINIVLVTLSIAWNDVYSARRYDFPMLIALSGLLLLSLDTWPGKVLAALRAGVLGVYLWSSLTYGSPLKDLHGILLQSGFDPARDCLSGTGGDVTTVQAQAGVLYTVISHKWRLEGNYSRAISPRDPGKIRSSCRRIFHVDTGEIPVSAAEAYCPAPILLYQETELPRYRPPVRLFACG